jgi:hypothetical protein
VVRIDFRSPVAVVLERKIEPFVQYWQPGRAIYLECLQPQAARLGPRAASCLCHGGAEGVGAKNSGSPIATVLSSAKFLISEPAYYQDIFCKIRDPETTTTQCAAARGRAFSSRPRLGRWKSETGYSMLVTSLIKKAAKSQSQQGSYQS